MFQPHMILLLFVSNQRRRQTVEDSSIGRSPEMKIKSISSSSSSFHFFFSLFSFPFSLLPLFSLFMVRLKNNHHQQ